MGSDDTTPPPGLDVQRALIVAMELLRTSIADLKASIADNAARFGVNPATNPAVTPAPVAPQPNAKPKQDENNKTSRDLSDEQRQIRLRDLISKRQRDAEDAMLASDKPGANRQMQGQGAMGMLAQKFGALIGPLQLFGQIIQSNASGFQIMGSAVQLLAATLAPVLLPITLALAAALLDLQEEIQGEVLSGMREWSRLIFGTLLPILGELVSMFRAVIDTLAEWMLAVGTAIADVGRWARDLFRSNTTGAAAGSAGVGDKIGSTVAKALEEEKKRKAEEEAKAKPPGAGGAPAGGGRRGIDDALATFRASFGAKAQYSGLADVGRNVQIAGLSGDPIQKRMVDLLARIADGVEGGRADARRGRPPEAPFRRGE